MIDCPADVWLYEPGTGQKAGVAAAGGGGGGGAEEPPPPQPAARTITNAADQETGAICDQGFFDIPFQFLIRGKPDGILDLALFQCR